MCFQNEIVAVSDTEYFEVTLHKAAFTQTICFVPSLISVHKGVRYIWRVSIHYFQYDMLNHAK